MAAIRPDHAQREARRTRMFVFASALLLLFCAPPAAEGAPQIVIASHEHASLGSVRSTVVDPNGNFVSGARIQLVREGKAEPLEVQSDSEGRFAFLSVAPGPFQIVITYEGFATQQIDGVLHFGEALELPPVALSVAAATTEIRVVVTNNELAEEQLKVEEAQRVIGIFPNFYVTYEHDALPLSVKQKFELAWKNEIDPVNFAATGAVAGFEQASNSFRGYGQGSEGYAKRYGATYADGFIGNMMGGAILPALFKQDPRYFYKGVGTVSSRSLYAIANAFVCKGDNGHWQADYSGILGSLAAGGISNIYYPASSRNGLQLTFENTFIGIGASAAGNLLQEFLIRKLTPHTHNP